MKNIKCAHFWKSRKKTVSLAALVACGWAEAVMQIVFGKKAPFSAFNASFRANLRYQTAILRHRSSIPRHCCSICAPILWHLRHFYANIAPFLRWDGLALAPTMALCEWLFSFSSTTSRGKLKTVFLSMKVGITSSSGKQWGQQWGQTNIESRTLCHYASGCHAHAT